MSTATIWNATVISDLPQHTLDEMISDNEMKRALADTMASVESRDLLVVRIDAFRKGVTGITMEAFPEKEYLGSYSPSQITAHVCPECTAMYYKSPHPDNGCRIGTVESVLSS